MGTISLSSLSFRRRLAALTASIALSAPAEAQQVFPETPTECDALELLVPRELDQDCQWTAEALVTGEGAEVLVYMELLSGDEPCGRGRQFRFVFDLGRRAPGDYVVRASWIDLDDDQEPIVIPVTVAAATCEDHGYRLGDTNDDGRLDISDPVSLLTHLFLGGPLGCSAAGDADGSSRLDITDAVFLLSFLFRGGVAPRLPVDECAPAIETSLGCDEPQCEFDASPPDLPPDTAWVARPEGCVQCELCASPGLGTVVDELREAGIEVRDSAELRVGVCEACFICPSGVVYAAAIPAAQLEIAEELGWTLWEGEVPLGER